jgi:Xaa-Pro aminopeptidase
VDRVFAIMLRRGLIPPPPPALQGMALKVEYTSIMAQAQKSVGLSNVERFLLTVGNLMQLTGDQSIGMKVDWEQAVDEIAIRSGLPPRVVRSDEDVAEIREAQAEQARAMQAAQMAETESKAARNLAAADTGGDNALTRVLAAGENSLPAQVSGGRL